MLSSTSAIINLIQPQTTYIHHLSASRPLGCCHRCCARAGGISATTTAAGAATREITAAATQGLTALLLQLPGC
jgi:hypothetical protein